MLLALILAVVDAARLNHSGDLLYCVLVEAIEQLVFVADSFEDLSGLLARIGLV